MGSPDLDGLERLADALPNLPAPQALRHAYPNLTDLAAAEALTRDLAALIALARSQEWRPISEAPKDGTRFLAFRAQQGFPDKFFVCSYNAPEARSEGRWHDRSANRWEQPTHFRPLPTPPEEE